MKNPDMWLPYQEKYPNERLEIVNIKFIKIFKLLRKFV